MPAITTSIEDYSPLLLYGSFPPWRPGTSDDDRLLDKYSDNSFTVSDTNGSTAFFSFNGTSVRIYGAKRGNHGDYQVTVDGNDYPLMSGTANESTFESTEVLFTTTLDPGLHNVSVVNLGSADPQLNFFDIDFVEWDTFFDDEEGPIVDTVQDTDTAFSYSPVSAWHNKTDHSGFFMGLTGHTSSQSSSFFTFSFSGMGVSLFGPIGPDYGNYAVELDGGTGDIFSASNVKFRPQVPLYHAVGLPSGPHSLKVTSLSNSAGPKSLAIDYANVFRHPASESAHSDSSSPRLSPAALGDVIFAIVLVVGVLGTFLFLYIRRRRKAAHNETPSNSPTQISGPSFGYTPYMLQTPTQQREVGQTFISPIRLKQRIMPNNSSNTPSAGASSVPGRQVGSPVELPPQYDDNIHV